MSKTVQENCAILSNMNGWNVTTNPLETMFINDIGELITGAWNEYHERCSSHSEYYQETMQDADVEYIEPIAFEPESCTLILPNRVFNYEERSAMLRIARAIDENLLDCYFEGDNEYVGAMQALVDAGAGAETTVMLFINGDIVFIDEDEYNELDDCEKESVFWTNDGETFTVSE